MTYSHDGNCSCARCGAEDDRSSDIEGDAIEIARDCFPEFIRKVWQEAGGDTNGMPDGFTNMILRELWDGDER